MGWWEYSVVANKDIKVLMSKLHQYGAEGWELVQVLNTEYGYTAFLKREL